MADTPESHDPSPMLGLRPLQQATEAFGRSTQQIVATQRATNQKLDALTKSLDNLAKNLGGGKGGAAASTGSGSSGTRTTNGGGSTIGGRQYHESPHTSSQRPGQHPGQQQPKPGNGGSPNFSFFGYNATPSQTAPGKVARFLTAWSGNTPKEWGTRYNTLEMGAQVGSHIAQRIGQRGLEQLDQETIGDLIRAEELSYGGSWADAERNGGMASLGSRSRTADNLGQTAMVGQTGRSSIQNAQDWYGGERLLRRFSGDITTEVGARRKRSIQSGADAFAYTNPTMSYETSNRIAANMIKPSNRMQMMLMGLPDPTGPDGTYSGNTNFFIAFMKRIYQGRDHVPERVFEDDFRETGVGWANLVQLFGEETADAMLPGLRAYNIGKNRGKDTSQLDTLFKEANTSGKAGDRARKTLERDFGVKESRINLGNRHRVQDLASEMSGNEEYVQAETAATEAMHIFSEAVHKFVNAPIIGDIANFFKGIGPALSRFNSANDGSIAGFFGMGSLGSGSTNGVTPPAGQGPIEGGGSGGSAPVPTGSGMEKTARSAENLGAEIAKRARGYATGSRKYKYSMSLRNKDGYFDCSSFVSRVYKQFGYNVGPTTVQMWNQGEPVDLKDVQPGDLLLWARGKPGTRSGSAEHVEMYIGGGKTVGTASAGPGQNTIQVQPYRPGDWDAARRIIGASKRGKGKKDPGASSSADSGTTSSGEDNGSSGSLLDKIGAGIKDLFGGGGGGSTGGGTAGTGGSVAGLGAANAASYSTDELSALMGILGGGGGGGIGGMLGAGGPGGDDSAAEEGSEKPPQDAKGTEQAPEKPTGDIEKLMGEARDLAGSVKLGRIRKDPNGKTKNYAPEKHPAPNPQSNKSIAKGLLGAYGWKDNEWAPLEKLWTRESSWNQYADNKSSDAYGIPQSLPGTKMASEGKDWRTNPATQIKWGLKYIKGRYGSPTKAWAHSEAKGWYDSGAWQIQDDQEAIVHKDEMIIPAKQAQTIRDALIRENVGGKVSGDRDPFPSDRKGEVVLNFSQGSIVLNFGSDVSAQAGQTAARGFLKELERHELYKQIARGGERRASGRSW